MPLFLPPGLALLGSHVLTSASASLDVASIPGGHGHLLLVIQCKGDGTSALTVAGSLRVNNDSGSNYDYNGSYVSESGGPSKFAGRAASGWQIMDMPTSYSGTGTGPAGLIRVQLPLYDDASFYKNMLSEGYGFNNISANYQYTENYGGQWRSTAAINRVTFYPASGNWVATSRMLVYGLL
jgi:hypothetical protein